MSVSQALQMYKVPHNWEFRDDISESLITTATWPHKSGKNLKHAFRNSLVSHNQIKASNLKRWFRKCLVWNLGGLKAKFSSKDLQTSRNIWLEMLTPWKSLSLHSYHSFMRRVRLFLGHSAQKINGNLPNPDAYTDLCSAFKFGLSKRRFEQPPQCCIPRKALLVKQLTLRSGPY